MSNIILSIILTIVAVFIAAYLATKLKFAKTKEDAYAELWNTFFLVFVSISLLYQSYNIYDAVSSSEPVTRKYIFIISFQITMLITTILSIAFLYLLKIYMGISIDFIKKLMNVTTNALDEQIDIQGKHIDITKRLSDKLLDESKSQQTK